jgi:hypothetical protein
LFTCLFGSGVKNLFACLFVCLHVCLVQVRKIRFTL